MQDTDDRRKAESAKLNDILAKHYELQVLAQKDVNVHAWFQMVYAGHCTVEEALIGLVVVVTKEKRAFFKMIVDMKAKLPADSMIIPPNARLTDNVEEN